MRLTQVSNPELMRKAEESRRIRSNATVEEMVETTHCSCSIQRDNNYHEQEIIIMKKNVRKKINDSQTKRCLD